MTVVEVALESLLRQWDPLVLWLREQASDLKEADKLDSASGEWERNGRNPEWLIEGVRLDAAEALAASPMFRDRVASAAEFLHASRRHQDAEAETERQRQGAELRAAQERQQAAEALAEAEQQAKVDAQQHAGALLKRTRILRAVLALAVVVALAAVVGFVVAFKARRDADARFMDATALRLYGDSQLMLAGLRAGGSDDVAGIQMLLAALEIPSTNRDKQYPLVTALQQERDLLKVIDTSSMLFSAAFSPDGTRFVSGGADNVVRIWDAKTGQPVGKPLGGHDGNVWVARIHPRWHPDRLRGNRWHHSAVGRHIWPARRSANAPRQWTGWAGVQPRWNSYRCDRLQRAAPAVGLGRWTARCGKLNSTPRTSWASWRSALTDVTSPSQLMTTSSSGTPNAASRSELRCHPPPVRPMWP